jgi:hypothetical protein
MLAQALIKGNAPGKVGTRPWDRAEALLLRALGFVPISHLISSPIVSAHFAPVDVNIVVLVLFFKQNRIAKLATVDG